MVSRTMSNNAALSLLIGQMADGVNRAAKFKSTRFLEVFAFEKDVVSDDAVQRLAADDGSPMGV